MPKKDERYQYIKFSQGDKMKPPGLYSYKDSMHKKTSHNKSQKNAYNTSDIERFS